MFGYIGIHKPELKMKEYYKYRAYYCGLCQVLKERYGRFGQMTLTYDMTFLIILLTSLYESKVTEEQHRCLAHPTKKHWMLHNEITEYAADMNIALTYHKLLDDWNDEKSMVGLSASKLLVRKYQKIEKKYPEKCQVIADCLAKLQEFEKENVTDLDKIAKPFGDLMGEMFVYRQDGWKDTLRKLGFYLGKFIYLLDAYEDVKEDITKGNFNPLKEKVDKPSFEDEYRQILIMMMSECSKEFERLPLVLDVELLRNIVYAGVWKKYDEHGIKGCNKKEIDAEGKGI